MIREEEKEKKRGLMEELALLQERFRLLSLHIFECLQVQVDEGWQIHALFQSQRTHSAKQMLVDRLDCTARILLKPGGRASKGLEEMEITPYSDMFPMLKTRLFVSRAGEPQTR